MGHRTTPLITSGAGKLTFTGSRVDIAENQDGPHHIISNPTSLIDPRPIKTSIEELLETVEEAEAEFSINEGRQL